MAIETRSSSVATSLSSQFSAVSERLLAGVVLVNSGHGSGSGTIWRRDGLIVTNHHVVRDETASVTLSTGERFSAEVEMRDHNHDLAALRIDATDLPALPPGDSIHTHAGQWVLAAGNPMGMRGVVTVGIITGVGQVPGPERTWLDNLIQADVLLAPGNSGGPLADAQGRVLGINAMIAASGIALAVPTHIVERFLEPAESDRTYLGITGTEVHVRINGTTRSAIVLLSVEEWGPAERAGLFQGDVLLSLNGTDVRSTEELQRVLWTHGGHASLEIVALRQSATRHFTVAPAVRAAA